MLSLLLLAALALQAPSQVQFDALGKRHLPPDRSSDHGVALVDVDGDGDLDVVVAASNQAANSRNRLYLNDGPAIFTDATDARMPAVSFRNEAVAAADVDGDGDADLLFATLSGPNLLFRNDGTGTFSYDPGDMPADVNLTTSLAVGDVDADGDLDVVFGNSWNQFSGFGRNRLLLNDGSGVFRETTDPANDLGIGDDFTNAVVLLDVDGDGDLDLVAGNSDDDPIVFPGRSRVYLNDGSGAFQPAPASSLPAAGINAHALAAGDVDGDGDLDLALGAIGGFGNPEADHLYHNEGGGVFADVSANRLPADSPVRATSALAFADLRASGSLDLLIGTFASENQLFVNDGSGKFFDGSGRLPRAPLETAALAVGDVDGDGDLDFHAANGQVEQDRMYLNDGTGRFSDALQQRGPKGSIVAYGEALGDVDGDGDVDFVLGIVNRQDELYLNDGLGWFSDATQQLPQAVDFTDDVLLADVDGDLDLDLVSAKNRFESLYANDGTGTFVDRTAQAFPASAGTTVALERFDADGDGDPDLALGTADGDRVRLRLNDGSGVFADASAGMPPAAEENRDLAAGDVDGDGDLDLLVAASSLPTGAQNRLYRNAGGATFVDDTATSLPVRIDSTTSLALGDVDADGDLDAVVGNAFVFSGEEDRLLVNDGTGSFVDVTGTRLPAVVANTDSVELFDADLDGDPDLLAAPLSFFQNEGGTFVDATAQTIGASVGGGLARSADLDGDGDLDLVLGDGPRTIALNLLHQLDAPLLARVGQDLRLDLYARGGLAPESRAAVFVAPLAGGAEALGDPLAGRFGAAPAVFAVPVVPIPQPGGTGTLVLAVPNEPSLAGEALEVRAVFLGSAPPGVRSNRLGETILR